MRSLASAVLQQLLVWHGLGAVETTSGKPPTLKPPPQRCAARCTGVGTSDSAQLRSRAASRHWTA